MTVIEALKVYDIDMSKDQYINSLEICVSEWINKCDIMAKAMIDISTMDNSLYMQAKARKTLHDLGIKDVWTSKINERLRKDTKNNDMD